jgi:hypothetical protein
MVLAALLYAVFALLATLGLFLLLRHHYGLPTAVPWSALLLLAFAALGWWVAWLAGRSGLP